MKDIVPMIIAKTLEQMIAYIWHLFNFQSSGLTELDTSSKNETLAKQRIGSTGHTEHSNFSSYPLTCDT